MSKPFSLRSLGLTEVETIALRDAAMELIPGVKELIGDYHFKLDYYQSALAKAVREKKITRDQAIDLGAASRICLYSVDAFKTLSDPIKKSEEHGFYTEHPSFGAASNHVYSSNNPRYVGTPSMSGNSIGLSFKRAEFSADGRFSEHPRLRETRSLVELEFSTEQFATIIRSADVGSPCGITRVDNEGVDLPPRLVASTSIAEHAKARALEIGAPLINAAKDLEAFLRAPEKISTKADYTKLREKVEAVHVAVKEVREPFQALLTQVAGDVAHASQRQLLAELEEPMRALGMDARDVLRLTSE